MKKIHRKVEKVEEGRGEKRDFVLKLFRLLRLRGKNYGFLSV
jgi:hypothetical protein